MYDAENFEPFDATMSYRRLSSPSKNYGMTVKITLPSFIKVGKACVQSYGRKMVEARSPKIETLNQSVTVGPELYSDQSPGILFLMNA